MASKVQYEIHHNFPKLADESGFSFNVHRPRMHVDWNKIRMIDINNLIRERKFVIIEQHINDILNCVLESEFDVRILNEEVLKMFRLAQLAVEYQQFCRQYLDRSVFVLKEEISSLVQELDITKKNLREKEEDIRKIRRKSKHTYRTPLPYGNDNIATMILKTLTNKGELFATSNEDSHQYNRCSHCDKVFLNQLYLKGHILRRHPYVMEIPQKDNEEKTSNNNINIENNKMNEEIKELKMKLKEMETLITENKKINEVVNNKPTVSNTILKETKDAEVSTNNEDYLLVKIEEWKKEEHEKYNKEITLLRAQIMETINSFKDKDNGAKAPIDNETNIIKQLHSTIKEQGTEISALRQELNNSRLKTEKENAQRGKEAEEQLTIWTKRVETQAEQYDLLLQKLNSVAKEAQDSRSLAEKEKERADELRVMLHESIHRKHSEVDIQNNLIEQQVTNKHKPKKNNTRRTSYPVKKEALSKTFNPTEISSKTLSDRKTLENLHQRAQELLNIESASSSSSDVSSLEKSFTKQKPASTIVSSVEDHKPNKNHNRITHNQSKIKNIERTRKSDSVNNNSLSKTPKAKTEKSKIEYYKSQISDTEKNGPVSVQRSPMRIVRAKITEEVNNRLVSAGMDPLKSRLHKSVFQKQRLQLQQQLEEKSKKIPSHEKIRHSILSYLDTTISKKDVPLADDYVSPDKIAKSFSLTSVLSNVKSKALSLVKSTDVNMKYKHKQSYSNVAKKAMSLLNTPPGSTHPSPLMEQHSPTNFDDANVVQINSKSYEEKRQSHSSKHNGKKRFSSNKPTEYRDTDSESIESDHKYNKTQASSKSIDNLIKSPARRPTSANADYNHSIKKYILDNGDVGLTRTQSAINVSSTLTSLLVDENDKHSSVKNIEIGNSDDAELLKDPPIKKVPSAENVQIYTKQTKSVLKNASSSSSLNRKKVLFDMDAIQMKSVSASPSQSITEKSDSKEKIDLGLINLDGEEWDISSIENEPLKNDTKIQINTRTSPKIAELKQTIESQLARRNGTPSTIRVGGVDVLGGPITRASSMGGSNTSLGSSILDDSDSVPTPNHKTFVKSKSIIQKDDSELDISEFSIEGIANKNESF